MRNPTYPSDVTDEPWALIEPLIPVSPGGRPLCPLRNLGQVSENPKSGPVRSHTRTDRNASAKAAELPDQSVASRAKRASSDSLREAPRVGRFLWDAMRETPGPFAG